MKEKIIEFHTAILAKKKGFWFDGKTNNWMDTTLPYKEDGTRNIDFTYEGEYFSAPTQSLLQKWLREKHEIYVDINSELDQDCFTMRFYFFIWKNTIPSKEIISDKKYKKYEHALETGLVEALKLINNDQ